MQNKGDKYFYSFIRKSGHFLSFITLMYGAFSTICSYLFVHMIYLSSEIVKCGLHYPQIFTQSFVCVFVTWITLSHSHSYCGVRLVNHFLFPPIRNATMQAHQKFYDYHWPIKIKTYQ